METREVRELHAAHSEMRTIIALTIQCQPSCGFSRTRSRRGSLCKRHENEGAQGALARSLLFQSVATSVHRVEAQCPRRRRSMLNRPSTPDNASAEPVVRAPGVTEQPALDVVSPS